MSDVLSLSTRSSVCVCVSWLVKERECAVSGINYINSVLIWKKAEKER